MNYEILKNRLTNGNPFSLEVAINRINALANNLLITQEQAEELSSLAEQNASSKSKTYDERLSDLELANFQCETALIEIANMLVSIVGGK